MKQAVVALGGNAFIKKGQKGNIHEQFANTREMCKIIVHMIKNGWTPILTHGNGPQVGSILLQNNKTRKILPPMPLGICVAETEGFMGYMIQQSLQNELEKENIRKSIITIITQVLVDIDNPSMKHPIKPIGPYYSEEESKQLIEDGYQITKQPQGYRIVVPSPDPISIIEIDVIKKLIEDDVIVIAGGGGGMPVIQRTEWGLDGIEAVVDKDLVSERIAEAINADLLLILTNVEYVYLYYNTEKQQKIIDCNLDEIKMYYQEGHFPAGSMSPKILAAIRFLEQGGKKVIITDVIHGWDAIQGKTGTHITI
ncbi:MAG: carbamate kinase [Promethearchaeota archaeon]|jgi:carbamate kinase